MVSSNPTGEILNTEAIPPAKEAVPENEAAITAALKNRSDLKAFQLNLANQELRTAYYKNQKRPQLNIIFTLERNGLAGEDREVSLFGSPQHSGLSGEYGDAFSSMIEDDGYQWAAGMRFQYPLDNRAGEARYAKNKLKARSLEYRLKRLKRHIRSRVTSHHLSAVRSLERVKASNELVRLSQKVLDQENQRLKKGLSNTFRILDFQEKLVEAHVREIYARVDFHQSMAGLYRAMGENLAHYDIVIHTTNNET